MSETTWDPPRPGTCGEPGPWGTRCTQYPNHDYACYDAGDDSSWTEDVMADFAEDHPEIELPADYLLTQAFQRRDWDEVRRLQDLEFALIGEDDRG